MPGPGAYDIVNPEAVNERSPKFGLGREIRGKATHNPNPGPG
jgi:hypothetical protein